MLFKKYIILKELTLDVSIELKSTDMARRFVDALERARCPKTGHKVRNINRQGRSVTFTW